MTAAELEPPRMMRLTSFEAALIDTVRELPGTGARLTVDLDANAPGGWRLAIEPPAAASGRRRTPKAKA